MNTLWLKDGTPYLFSTSTNLTQDQAASLRDRLTEWREGIPFVVSGMSVEVRHVGSASPAQESRWTTGAAWAFALVTWMLGVLLGAFLP